MEKRLKHTKTRYAAAYELEYIYWNEVVTERGSYDNKNHTKCIYDYSEHSSDTKIYRSTGGSASFRSSSAIRIGTTITWDIDLVPTEYISNPATVFVETIYSETLYIYNPPSPIEEYFDFYPDDSLTYYTQEKTGTEMPILAFFGFSIITFVIIKKYRKKS